ncbi:glycine cleavage system protein GcvH [bacterium]|nr:glycine cleavage system protein GcvH [bacterium]
MSNYNVPSELRYSRTHEWVMDLGNKRYRLGITDFAAQHAGDITYVELPETETVIDKDGVDCTIETVKSSEDICNQITGTVTAVNDMLEDSPETVSSDCYGDGWLYEVEAENDEDFSSLMTAEEYEEFLATQED